MADFHLDQNAPPRLAIELRRLGHTAVTAYDLQMQRALDAEHLLRAWQDSRVLVSRDLDYRELHIAWLQWPLAWGHPPAPLHPGILLVLSDWPVAVAAHELDLIVNGSRPLAGHLYRYYPGQGWQVYP